ncbi:MAG: hypothetical protein VYD19_03115, partial [Myxococcota bacterium]|nr:hypothetical protein [Myxococcota bacterium]
MAELSQLFDSLRGATSRALLTLSLAALSCYGCEERSPASSGGQRDQAIAPRAPDQNEPTVAKDQGTRDRGDEGRGEERDQRLPPEPAEWPTPGTAELDGAAALLEPVQEGQARAGWVDEPAEALGGANARCRVGCLRLDNEKISVCLEGLRTDRQYSFTGGGIVDATLAGDPDGDGLGLILPAPSLGEVRFESAGIIRDGSEGGAAIIQLRGRSQGSRLILGYIPSAQVPAVPVVVEYRLSPGADFLELLLWFGGEEQTVSRMHEILDFGDSSVPLMPGLARGEISPGPFPYLAAYNERVA